jgi:hypothetical protein
MNFMTPDLLARLQYETTVDSATEQWMTAIAEYEKRLRTIRKHLPRGARALAFRQDPHDGQVLMVGFSGDGATAIIVLKLDEAGNRRLVLEYDLLKKPEWSHHPELADFGGSIPLWLYDEFDAVEEHDMRFFIHSILFSNGRELRLSFKRMRCKTIEQYLGMVHLGDSVATGEKLLQTA